MVPANVTDVCTYTEERGISMKVLVIGMNGLGLMPTTPRKARILLKSGKAEVVRKIPFTIKLLYKTGCATQDIDVGIDTGSQHIGVSIVSEDRVLSKEEYALRSTMEKRSLLETRKTYRRGRRYRKVRYRKAKFKPHTKRTYQAEPTQRNKHLTHWKKETNAFGSNRQAGWLPPSIQSKVDHHIRIIERYMEALPPRTKLHIESARMDIARIKDPTIHGEMYQKGRLYDEENVKAYVFARDGYKCKICGKKAGTKRADNSTVKIVAHHIDFRSKGATDNPDRMITVCDKCHSTSAHKPGGILYQWMIEDKRMTRGYRDETFMNILRKRLFKAFPDASYTYGNITAANRKAMGLTKSHANDAVAIACEGRNIIDTTTVRNANDVETVYYQQVRSRKRSLHEANPRKGRKEPNRRAKRNAKNTKAVTINRKVKDKKTGKTVKRQLTFHVYDKVSLNGQTGWISGFTKKSAYVRDEQNNFIKYTNKEYSNVNLSDLKVISHNNNWLIGPREPIGR